MTTTPDPRDRILDTAFRLFYAHGVRGVGVDTIIAEAGVAKATLYKHFPSKDELVIGYLDRADAAWRGALRAAAEAAGPAPRDQLVGLFDALASACHRDGYHGCAFINTAAETDPSSPVHARTISHKRAVREWVRELAFQAGAKDPDALAHSLTLILDGGLASGALDASPDAPAAAVRAARALIDSSCPVASR
jgi:AcrR family transcriptional regulator